MISRKPTCGPVGRPKSGLPGTPATPPNAVRLKALNASGRRLRTTAALSNLDPGERAAIALGITLKADLILIDVRRGYAAAVSKGFDVTGTLGILDLAAKRQMINLRHAIGQLKQTNFRFRKELIERLLAQHRDTQAA